MKKDRKPLAPPATLALATVAALNLLVLHADDAATVPSVPTSAQAVAPTNPPATLSDPQEKSNAESLLMRFREEQDITNSLEAVMVWIPAGYRVGRTEVTQAQYQKVMGSNPSHFQGPSRPVEMVSPQESMEFCRRLTAREHEEGTLPKEFAYGLPSEQEFNTYVAGTALETAYVSFIGDHTSTIAVASMPPNDLGLCDVRGNVWEWCQGNVARGASYQSHEDYLAPSFRFVGQADSRIMDIGFRIVLRDQGR